MPGIFSGSCMFLGLHYVAPSNTPVMFTARAFPI